MFPHFSARSQADFVILKMDPTGFEPALRICQKWRATITPQARVHAGILN